jgi:hypothetical protein
VADARELIAKVVRRARDVGEARRRYFPAAATARPDLGLTSLQLYPEGTNFHAHLRDAAEVRADELVIHRDTPVGSIGSCFAEEFATHMVKRGLNYVVTESNPYSFSADWGRVYTPVNFAQIVAYSFDDTFPVVVEHAAAGWFDPLREHSVGLLGEDEAAARSRVSAHRAASREAFASVDVLALTLGQNESWLDTMSGLHWAAHPKRLGHPVDEERFHVVQPRFAEALDHVVTALTMLFEHNPRLHVVLTVSPVPAHAVFGDVDVVTSSFGNKCLLRTVADAVCTTFPDRVRYFPSFEAVLAHNPASYRADNRHVRRASIERIFSMLDSALIDRRSVVPTDGAEVRG